MRSGAAIVAVLLMLGGGSVRAQEGVPEDKKAQAQELFASGKAHHDAGEYEEAAAAYRAAYELYPSPLLLYNVGQVKRLGGDAEGAITYYEKYLELEPGGRFAERARGFLARLREGLAEEKKEKEGEGEGVGEEAEGGGLDQDQDQDQDQVRDQGRARDGSGGGERVGEEKGRIKRVTGMAVAGVGAVSLAVGIKFGFDAMRYSDEASELRGVYEPAEHEALYRKGEDAERNMLIFTGAGALAVAGGAALFYIGYREAQVAPMASGESAGVVVSGRF